MQRWGGILFCIPSFPKTSVPRLLTFRILPLYITDSGTGGNDDQTNFLRTICWLVQRLLYSSSTFVSTYSNICFCQGPIINFDVFSDGQVRLWDYMLVSKFSRKTSGHWLLYVLIVCSSMCLGMGLRWFLNWHKLRSEVCIGRVWIAAAKSLLRVWKLHIGLRACYGKKVSCNALELGYMKYLTSDWFC